MFAFAGKDLEIGLAKWHHNRLTIGKNQINITVIQANAPTSNAEEAKVEQFYEDLQVLLELTPQKMSFSLQGTGMQT